MLASLGFPRRQTFFRGLPRRRSGPTNPLARHRGDAYTGVHPSPSRGSGSRRPPCCRRLEALKLPDHNLDKLKIERRPIAPAPRRGRW
ncbi:hypothetical protein, partial [Burkholderia stabilis]|uniref:hypothetical protein n=1 Tax=Burkholderia stabilis TaxID=95485 RepID=UPI003B982E8B